MNIKSVTSGLARSPQWEREGEKINFRPKKFNQKNLSNLSTSTHTHSRAKSGSERASERKKHRSQPCMSEEYNIILL